MNRFEVSIDELNTCSSLTWLRYVTVYGRTFACGSICGRASGQDWQGYCIHCDDLPAYDFHRSKKNHLVIFGKFLFFMLTFDMMR